MDERTERTIDRVLRGALAGLVAGATASFAMDRFQAVVGRLSSGGDAGGEAEPSTQKAADAVAETLTGEAVPDADKPLAGQAVHYALGIGLCVAYGVAAEFRPSVTAGSGLAFGATAATLLDEGVVPAVGLGEPFWKAGLASSLYSYASHAVFGGTAEFVRSQVAATLVR